MLSTRSDTIMKAETTRSIHYNIFITVVSAHVFNPVRCQYKGRINPVKGIIMSVSTGLISNPQKTNEHTDGMYFFILILETPIE